MLLRKKINGSPVLEAMGTYTVLFLLMVFVVFSVQNYILGSRLENEISQANRQAITEESWNDAAVAAITELNTAYGETGVLVRAEILDGDNLSVILASTGSLDGSTALNENSAEMEAHWQIGNRLVLYAQRDGQVRTVLGNATTFNVAYREEPFRLIRNTIIERSELVIENNAR